LLATWGERWAWTLLHSLWQHGLLTIGLWVVLRLLPARRAEMRYSAALAAFTLAAIAPLVTWAWLGDSTDGTTPGHAATLVAETVPTAGAPGHSSDSSEPSALTTGATSKPEIAPDEQPAIPSSRAVATGRSAPGHSIFIPLILAAWGLGAAIQLLRTIRDLSATRALLRGESVLSTSLQARLARVVDLLQLRRRFQVVVSATQAGPFVLSSGPTARCCPKIVPACRQSAQFRQQMLRHGLAAFRRSNLPARPM